MKQCVGHHIYRLREKNVCINDSDVMKLPGTGGENEEQLSEGR